MMLQTENDFDRVTYKVRYCEGSKQIHDEHPCDGDIRHCLHLLRGFDQKIKGHWA